MTSISTAPSTRARPPAEVSVSPVPTSAPAARPWPAPGHPDVAGPNQPPLPWSTDRHAGQPPLPLTDDRAPAVRTVEFGASWAGPDPDDLPAARSWAIRLAQVLMEALQGRRPLAQLSRWLDPAALAALTRQLRHRAGPHLLQLQAIHLHRTTATIVEAVALYRAPGHRLRPVAFRLEARGERWVCTALDVEPRATVP